MSSEERCPRCGKVRNHPNFGTYCDCWLYEGHSPAPVDAEPELLTASDVATKLANCAGHERWRQILQGWLESYISRWREEEAVRHEAPAEGAEPLPRFTPSISGDMLQVDDGEWVYQSDHVEQVASLREQLAQAQEQIADLKESVRISAEHTVKAQRELEEARAACDKEIKRAMLVEKALAEVRDAEFWAKAVLQRYGLARSGGTKEKNVNRRNPRKD